MGDWAELTGAEPVAEAAREEAPDIVRVWAGVWPVFELFIAAERLWRYPALGGPPIGLDWAQLRVLADGYGVPWDRTTLVLIQAAEAEAGGIWLAEWKRKNPPKTKG
ncbi:DUF1799 domain-containing protein [Azospirillum agricola]|uniref:DUF1799 domain-containing protein n=1 Tax=Azospirillum agricola TaxID=1720247 RepID=UPI000A0EFC3A|nr:DUF1799 domain-containing protein [Azospirillum agricola]SMH62529.1 Phage related hypothetical protein [Azospirillum lipoferum]